MGSGAWAFPWRLEAARAGLRVLGGHPHCPGSLRTGLASLDHISQRTGYQVRVDLKTGIRRTVEWLGGS